MSLPDRVYTHTDVEKARTKGQVIGWLQGGAVVAGGFMLLGAIGWIPTIVAVGVGGYLLYRLLIKKPRKQPE